MREVIYNDTQLEEAAASSIIAGARAEDFYQEFYSYIKNHEGEWNRALSCNGQYHVMTSSILPLEFLQKHYDVLFLVRTGATVAEPHEKPFIF